jgi:methylated-DNA-[protein]-cysteine S-methyltransferase
MVWIISKVDRLKGGYAMIFSTEYVSPLGLMLLASDGTHLVGGWFAGQKYFGQSLGTDVMEKDELPVFQMTKEWLNQYFNDRKPEIHALPLAPKGTGFQHLVWDVLCAVPYGKTMTYKEIAQVIADQLGKTHMACQAVGGAVGHNPISIIIPCHRVVGADGSLTGYAGGIHKKAALLTHEKTDMSRLYIPSKGTALE